MRSGHGFKQRRVTPTYLPFEQAVADGAVEVREIGAGTVPSLQQAVTKDRPVVIFAGDAIVGGKQNGSSTSLSGWPLAR